MIVTGDNIFRLGSDSAFGDAIVCRVFRYGFYMRCFDLTRSVKREI